MSSPGRCVVLAWGPPWQWWPSLQRSRHGTGWSLVWLWWGLYWCRVGAGTLLLQGAYPRCDACQAHAAPEELWFVTCPDGEPRRICRECRQDENPWATW